MFTFNCTACGKCCHGWLPLTLSESLDFAATAPLALIWNAHRRTVRPSAHYTAARKLFTPVSLPGGGEAVPWIRTVVLVPPETPCRHLSDGLCAIHGTKPLRCRTMPFHANLQAEDQEPHLKPKAGWPCFNPPDGKPIYDHGRFLDTAYRDAYRAEAKALAADARILGACTTEILKTAGETFLRLLAQVSATPGGYLVVPWSRLAPHLAAEGHRPDTVAAALHAQAQVLADWLARPAPESYRNHYRTLAEDLAAAIACSAADKVSA